MLSTLGIEVKDVLTGFQGFTTGRTVYLNGCVSYGISYLKDGELKCDWIDEQRLIRVDTGVALQEDVPAPLRAVAGGPQPNPPSVTAQK